jgi:hypothetical protein
VPPSYGLGLHDHVVVPAPLASGMVTAGHAGLRCLAPPGRMITAGHADASTVMMPIAGRADRPSGVSPVIMPIGGR